MSLTKCVFNFNISKSNKYQGCKSIKNGISTKNMSKFKNVTFGIKRHFGSHTGIKLYSSNRLDDIDLKSNNLEENEILNELSDDLDLEEDMESMSFEEGDLGEEDSGDENHKTGYIALIGLPNVGKSTLLNSLIGQKLSIVTEKPQTTRNRILGLVSEEDYQMIFMDTPGILTRSRTELDKRMMISIKQAITTADIIFCILDLTDNPKADLEMIQLPRNWEGPSVCVILNKRDLISVNNQNYYLNWFKENCRCDAVFMTCAKTGEGIEALKEWAVSKLPHGPALYPKDIVSEQPERFFVTEIIREKIFFYFRQEIPYSIQVNILEFQEIPGEKDYISVEVITERPSQRAMLLGHKGKAIHLWRVAATADIERFLQRPVNLHVYIKVMKDWRKNTDFLQKIQI